MALSVIYGIEIDVVLKDIRGARDREVEAIARWMLEAPVDAALAQSAGTDAQAPRGRPARRRAARALTSRA